MAEFIPWSSQPLDDWVEKYARGNMKTLERRGRLNQQAQIPLYNSS
jgi:hypothetical protein